MSLPRDVRLFRRQSRTLSAPVKPVPDHFTPHPPPINWIGLGDSYTASPGTGEDFDQDKECLRNVGSYVVQLDKDFPFNETEHSSFVACSGYTAPDVLTSTIPQLPQDKADFMVMTLGGNDIGFAKIAVDCLILNGLIFGRKCEQTLAAAVLSIKSVTLQANIHSVYDELFAKMIDDSHYQVYHMFYSRFFDDTTVWCDGQKLARIQGPYLSVQIRQRLNALADLLNARLQEIAERYIDLQRGRASWAKASRLITINPDKVRKPGGAMGSYGLYDGHRFCEPGVTTLLSDNVWFFGVADYEWVHPVRRARTID